MRLLISANSFYPAVGGYEGVAFTIADQLASRGHQVKIITFTPCEQDAGLPFEVYRTPGFRTMLELLRWSDIYMQNNVSFRLLWPLLFCWRPLCVCTTVFTVLLEMLLTEVSLKKSRYSFQHQHLS